MLDLMRDVRERLGTAIILITHNLGVVADIADRVLVMYAGRKAEEAPVRDLFAEPQHPYTIGLLGAIPLPLRATARTRAAAAARDPRSRAVARASCRRCAPSPTAARARTSSRARACPSFATCGPDHLVACFHPGPG